MSIKTDALIIGGIGVALLGAGWLARRQIAAAAGAVAGNVKYFNPANPENLAYQGVNGIGAAATGDQSFALGVWLYNLTHADPLATPVATSSKASPDPVYDYMAYAPAYTSNPQWSIDAKNPFLMSSP